MDQVDRTAPTEPPRLVLVPGRFYRSRVGDIWCCFKVDKGEAAHCAARCVRVDDDRIEYFFLDGRYDAAGKREHTLVFEFDRE